jgi:hypothetical protein
MKFGMDIIPLKTTLNYPELMPYSLSTIGNTTVADPRTGEVGTTLEPHTIGSENEVSLKSLKNMQPLSSFMCV